MPDLIEKFLEHQQKVKLEKEKLESKQKQEKVKDTKDAKNKRKTLNS